MSMTATDAPTVELPHLESDFRELFEQPVAVVSVYIPRHPKWGLSLTGRGYVGRHQAETQR